MGVAQLVERRIVVPVAEGSNPSTHPSFKRLRTQASTKPFMWPPIGLPR